MIKCTKNGIHHFICNRRGAHVRLWRSRSGCHGSRCDIIICRLFRLKHTGWWRHWCPSVGHWWLSQMGSRNVGWWWWQWCPNIGRWWLCWIRSRQVGWHWGLEVRSEYLTIIDKTLLLFGFLWCDFYELTCIGLNRKDHILEALDTAFQVRWIGPFRVVPPYKLDVVVLDKIIIAFELHYRWGIICYFTCNESVDNFKHKKGGLTKWCTNTISNGSLRIRNMLSMISSHI